VKPGEAVALWGISRDAAEDSKILIERASRDGKGTLAFPLLSDPEHKVIDAYGLQDPRYAKLKQEGIPSPTTIVIDKQGRIAWMRIDRDHTVRPPNAEIRAALDALK
jgi:peroxiredoxin